MSLYYVTLISGFSIVLPFVIAMWMVSSLRKRYMPIVILLSVGFANETISSVANHFFSRNAVNGNIYVLIEYLLIIWQFNIMCGNLSKIFLGVLIISGAAVWLLDNMILHSINDNNSIFRIAASLWIVYLSIDKANQILFFKGPVLLWNTDLIISIGFIIYFSFKTYVEVFNVFDMPGVKWNFYERLWTVSAVVNFFTNILLTIALLCSRKKEYIIHSSQG